MSDYPDLVEEPLDAPVAPPGEAAAPAPAPAADPPYLDFLASEGYRPEVDEDGDVRFRHEGRNLFLVPYPQDPCYFCVTLPGVVECEGPEEEARALEVANAVNRLMKSVKCVLVDGVVWISVEQFLERPESYRAVFARCVDVVGAAAWQVRERMRASGD